MLIKDILKEFIFELQIKHYSVRTQKSYRNNNALFHTYLKREFEIVELEEVTHLHIKQYMNYLHQRGNKPTYVNSILKTLRAFFQYCVQEDYMHKNIAKQVKWAREGTVLIKTFTDDEIINMMKYYKGNKYLDIRNKCILAMLIDTGVRNLELCQLPREDVGETIIKILGKGNKERYVPISPVLKKYMIKYERVREEYYKNKNLKHNNYFLSYRGKPLTVEGVERVVKESGVNTKVRKDIRVSPHTLRHYFAQKQLQNGLDVYSLSRLLGHENISITKRYLQSIEDENIVSMSIKTSPLMNL